MRERRNPEVIQADKLWTRVRDSFLGAEKALIAIIETEAWKPLGYRSFTEAWDKEMDGITIAAEIRAYAVYQMLSEGLTPTEIADVVKGVGPETVQNLERERENGVPADLAAGRTPGRKKGTDATVFVHPGPERKARWELNAADRDMSLTEFIIAVVDQACDER